MDLSAMEDSIQQWVFNNSSEPSLIQTVSSPIDLAMSTPGGSKTSAMGSETDIGHDVKVPSLGTLHSHISASCPIVSDLLARPGNKYGKKHSLDSKRLDANKVFSEGLIGGAFSAIYSPLGAVDERFSSAEVSKQTIQHDYDIHEELGTSGVDSADCTDVKSHGDTCTEVKSHDETRTEIKSPDDSYADNKPQDDDTRTPDDDTRTLDEFALRWIQRQIRAKCATLPAYHREEFSEKWKSLVYEVMPRLVKPDRMYDVTPRPVTSDKVSDITPDRVSEDSPTYLTPDRVSEKTLTPSPDDDIETMAEIQHLVGDMSAVYPPTQPSHAQRGPLAILETVLELEEDQSPPMISTSPSPRPSTPTPNTMARLNETLGLECDVSVTSSGVNVTPSECQSGRSGSMVSSRNALSPSYYDPRLMQTYSWKAPPVFRRLVTPGAYLDRLDGRTTQIERRTSILTS